MEPGINVLFLPLWICVDKCLELRVRYCVYVHVERVQVDSMHRLFVIHRLIVLAAHLELPRGNEHHACRDELL